MTGITETEFLSMLQNDNAPMLDQFPATCAIRDRENFITMWYAVALMKCNPNHYPAAKAQLKESNPKIDPYDAVYAVAFLLLFNRHTTQTSESESSKSFASRAPIAPKYGPSGSHHRQI